jgi:predicted GNAT superfamily acetyltransferase
MCCAPKELNLVPRRALAPRLVRSSGSWLKDENCFGMCACRVDRFAGMRRPDFFVGCEQYRDIGTIAQQVSRGDRHDHSGLHVEDPRAIHSTVRNAPWDTRQGADRPHGVEVPKQQEPGIVRAPVQQGLIAEDLQLRRGVEPLLKEGVRVLGDSEAGSKVVARRLNLHQITNSVDHPLLQDLPVHESILYGAQMYSVAEASLAAAEQRAGVQLRVAADRADLNYARTIFDEVWPSSATQLQANLLHAIVHAGGYCSIAVHGDHVVGAAMGVLGRHRDSTDQWRVHLHSHMAAVLPEYRDRHIGSALKVHQRLWALDHEIPVVTWTFDPLVRRNAYVNLIKLGTEVRGYAADFYGPMDDGINVGDPTDRMFAWWEVKSARADAAAAGEMQLMTPQPGQREVPIPDDIVEIRRADPQQALRWRLDVREQMTSALDAGYRVVGLSTNSAYLLDQT